MKGCRRNERIPFFSGVALTLVDGDFVDGDFVDGDFVDGNLVDGDRCDPAAAVLATCEAELLKLWLLAEFADELEPPE